MLPITTVVSIKKTHINLIFLGHVDAGKSTVAGHLLQLTGQVDERTMEKIKREAAENNRATWSFAYLLDTNEEERARGKTVEVGRAYFETGSKRVTVIDAPGHRSFVPNMILGLAQADIGALVVSAKTGEFESGFEKGGQTREHAILAKTMGLSHLIVVVNKMDEVEWSQTRFDEIRDKLHTFLIGVGWRSPVYIPISGFIGTGLLSSEQLRETCSWYRGLSFLDTLDTVPPIARSADGVHNMLRMTIAYRFADMGCIFVVGKVESGSIKKGQSILIMPSNQQAKVKCIYLRDDIEVDDVGAGESIRVGLVGDSTIIDTTNTGSILCHSCDLPRVTQELTVQLVVLEMPSTNPLFTAGYECIIHIHTCSKECVVSELVVELDKKTRKPRKFKPTFVRIGGVVNAKLLISAPICVELFSKLPQLGRFILRDKGLTIAAGKILA